LFSMIDTDDSDRRFLLLFSTHALFTDFTAVMSLLVCLLEVKSLTVGQVQWHMLFIAEQQIKM